MDGITEPVVLVLGHPIAGNPAQFALERAFEALKLPWRVLSCDVPPNRVAEAIAGAEVLGFRGLLLDQNLLSVGESSGDPSDRETGPDAEREGAGGQEVPSLPGSRCDLYWRKDRSAGSWNRENVLATWLRSQILDRADPEPDQIGPLLWIGRPDPRFPSDLASEQTHSPIAWASTESIEHAKLIAISEPVDVSGWPDCKVDAATLVVDFANPPNDVGQLRSLGYDVLGREETRIGILLECIERWTGKQAPAEILVEAVEEYLAV